MMRIREAWIARSHCGASWLAALLVPLLACSDAAPPAESLSPQGVAAPFVDLPAAAGLAFQHDNGMSGARFFSEIMGAGSALFDYDNDGDLDLYLVQGHPLGDEATRPDGTPRVDQLFRNTLESGSLGFENVTVESGLDASGYGMGTAAGDFDNDGWIDLYVTNFGANQLWRNQGDGTFREVTDETGAGDARWSTSAAWLDLDGDGWLDLYVTNYVDFRLATNKTCRGPSGLPDYCNPQSYEAEPDRLLRNRGGDGVEGLPRFEDISGPAGLLRAPGNGLGVMTGDLDLDGRIDLYVANDLGHNRLWRNAGDGTLVETGLVAGAAVNLAGQAEGSMGIALADVDGDGDEDLFVSHLRSETNTLYRNDGEGHFLDATSLAQLATPSLGATGFGTAFVDVDLDGALDLVVVNGAVTVLEDLLHAEDPYPFHQPNQLFFNTGTGTFVQHDAGADPVWRRSEVSRGLAVGDLDNDGDADLVVTNNHGPVRVLINQMGTGAGWLGLRMVTTRGRDALGARVQVANARPVAATVRSDGSYLTSGDPRLRFAVDGETAAVDVWWPSGQHERWDTVHTGRYSTLEEGSGTTIEGHG